MTDICTNNNTLILSDGNCVNYDTVIFAHGCDICTYGISGAQENCHFIKTYDDSIKLKKTLNTIDKSKHIVVIGAGPTGVELTGVLLDNNFKNIRILDALPRPLPMLSENISEYVVNFWKKFNILHNMNTMVKQITPNKIYTTNDNFDYDIAIWTGGTQNNKLTNNLIDQGFSGSRNGLVINNDLSIKNNIYAMGDCVNLQYGKTAQSSYQQGVYLGHKLCYSNKEPFKYNHKGQFIYLGNGQSIYQYKQFYSGGKLMGYLNRIVNLYNAVDTYTRTPVVYPRTGPWR